jgi:hypothetical protein
MVSRPVCNTPKPSYNLHNRSSSKVVTYAVYAEFIAASRHPLAQTKLFSKGMYETMPNQPFVHLGDGHANLFEDFDINVSDSTRPALGIGNQNHSIFRRFNITQGDSFKAALSARRPDLTRSQIDDIFEILRRYPDEPVKRGSSLAAIGGKILNGASLAFDIVELARSVGLLS